MVKEDLKKNITLNISYLMIVFLLLSSLANYYNDRFSFSILYLVVFCFTGVFLAIYKKDKKIDKLLKSLFMLLFLLFFMFFFIGDQSTFDVFWILIIPFLSIMVMPYETLKKYLIFFNLLLSFMIVISYIYPHIINFNQFALMSLFWASIFTSYISLYYKKIEKKLQQEIEKYQQNLEAKVQKATKDIVVLNQDLEETQKEILQRLGSLGEYRSNETATHVVRVGLYAKKLALLYGLDNEEAELLNLTAPLHDIGKVGIADSILNKPAKLTQDEFTIMKEHVTIGESILSGSTKPMIQKACEVAGTHHEKYDGSGYPKGLKADEIPLSGRIVAIVDVFDALFSKRVYKRSWSIEEIILYYQEQKGKHFDPKLVELFLDNIDTFIKIYKDNP